MTRGLPRHSDSLSHLAVDGGLSTVLVRGTVVLLGGSVPLFVGLARRFLFLLFGLPFLADFFEL